MSSQANRGKPFEDALGSACRFYERHGRGCIRKRHALIARRKGDVDFSGHVTGQVARSFYAEAKSTHEDALPLSKLEERPHQIAKLTLASADGCISGVLIGFLPEWSCWWVPWEKLGPFLAAPWRRSINRNMCAAWGLHLPVRANAAGKPMVMFLDGVPFTERERCISLVDADRLANPLELAAPRDDDWKPRRRRAQELPPPKTAIEAEIRERAGGLDPFHPEMLRRFAKRMKGRTR